jgi:hypothetical protein
MQAESNPAKESHIIGLLVFLLGAALFVFVGTSFERTSSVSMRDFNVVYSGARCLLDHCDPYIPAQLERVYMSRGGGHPSEGLKSKHTVTLFIYPPTGLLLTAPVAFLDWGRAHILWMTLTASSLIFAAFLMWNVAAKNAPVVSACLIGLLLLTSELLIEVGNIAGITISLSVIAAWCFLERRASTIGILCLAVSLLIKPQDAGPVWLYFLLAGDVHRKRALQTLVVALLLALPSVLWVSHIAPGWVHELRVNLAAHSVHGADSDPGPTGLETTSHGAQLVNLQTVFSVFWDDPRFYNPVTYVGCGILILVWAITVIRSQPTLANAYFALASISALSMLPTYHRQQDTRLLLLVIPAFALLWSDRGRIRWLALCVTTAGIFFTGDMILQILALLGVRFGASNAGVVGKTVMLVFARPAPLSLLATGMFFLLVEVRPDRIQRT